MSRFTRSRRAAAALALATSVAWPLAAWAQAAFPTQGLRIVNAFPPGGPSDIITRAVADKMAAALKQTVVVDNKAGAGGNLAAAEVAKSVADGHTILTGIDTTFTVNPHVYERMPFAAKDLKPLMVMASSGLLVGTHPSLDLKTLAELVAKAKAGQLMFSSGSNGSPGHLAVAILNDSTGARVTHVPYKGNSPAVMAVLSGEVQAGVLATPGMLPHVKAGKITALAVTGRQRSPMAPELPTVAEAGLKALELEVLYVAMVPAATPEPVMAVLRKALADALAHSDVRAQLARLDMVPEGQVGDEAARRLGAQGERFARIIKATGMKIE